MTLDYRLLQISIILDDEIITYNQDFYLKCSGNKSTESTGNTARVTIANLSKDTLNKLNNNSIKIKQILIQAGRISTGLQNVFLGDILEIKTGQKPDNFTTFSLKSGYNNILNTISIGDKPINNLSVIVENVASQLNLTNQFEATDKQIPNFIFNGSAKKLIKKLEELANIDIYQDDDLLVTKDLNQPIKNRFRIIKSNQIIGQPEQDDDGIILKTFYDIYTKVGDEIEVTSTSKPEINGKYTIYQLDFDLSSRENPFYYTIKAE